MKLSMNQSNVQTLRLKSRIVAKIINQYNLILPKSVLFKVNFSYFACPQGLFMNL